MSLGMTLFYGVLGMVLTIPLRGLLRKPEDTRIKLAAVGLVIAAGIYVISGILADALPRELGGLLIFGGFAVMAVGRIPLFIIVGWLAHIGWDVLALFGITGHALAPWYPPLCIGFDLALALMLALSLRPDPYATATA